MPFRKTKRGKFWSLYILATAFLFSISSVISNNSLRFNQATAIEVPSSILPDSITRAAVEGREPAVIRVQLPRGLTNSVDTPAWRLVRTPGPEKGTDVVSVMRTVDTLRSDAGFAGFMIRCRDKAPLQVGLVVIRPFPPRARPRVSVSDGRTQVRFTASVLPGGSLVALPDEAETLVKGAWQAAKELTVEIEGGDATIHGVVSLNGLSGALHLLLNNCAAS